MNKLTRLAVDVVAIAVAIFVVSADHGRWWGLAAGVVTAVYGAFCFTDGITRK